MSDAVLCHHETHTWTGSGEGRCNEDFALVAPPSRCAVLVDGATGLTKVNLVAGESDAAWYARTLTQELVSQLACASTPTLSALAAAGKSTAQAYATFPGASELQRIDEPNGSLAILRWHGSSLEVTMLGDCTAVVGLRDGSWHAIHDDTLSVLDGQNYERMFQWAREHQATMAEARRALNPRFIENRLKMNEPGGYWAADVSCRGLAHAATTTFALDAVRCALVCSDGYAQAVEMGALRSPEELAARVAAGQGLAVGEELRELEHADAGCWRVHRSKTSDDATYAYVAFACSADEDGVPDAR